MKELYADRSSIWRWKKYSICKSKNYLQIKELFAHQNVICRLKSYLQIEKLFAEQQIIYRLKKYLTCRSKNYLQIKKLFVDQGNVCRSKKYFICSSKKYSICKSKNYQQTKQSSALSRNYVLIKAPAADWRIIFQSDWRTICRLKAYLQIKESSFADWRSAHGRGIWYANRISADWRIIIFLSIFRSKFGFKSLSSLF